MTQPASRWTPEQYADWQANPVTVEFRHHLNQQLSELKNRWSLGDFTGDTAEKTAMLNANAVGQTEILVHLLEAISSEPEIFLTESQT